jgi:hypothetical protein
VLAACAVAGALLTGCGQSGGTSAPATAPSSAGTPTGTSAGVSAGPGSDSSAPSDADLARMRKLVNDADSAAAAAESDAAGDSE